MASFCVNCDNRLEEGQVCNCQVGNVITEEKPVQQVYQQQAYQQQGYQNKGYQQQGYQQQGYQQQGSYVYVQKQPNPFGIFLKKLQFRCGVEK